MVINYSDQEVIKNKKSIFIAGPTPRDGNVKSWRTTACEKLNELGFDGGSICSRIFNMET